jgi:hypothetical protein
MMQFDTNVKIERKGLRPENRRRKNNRTGFFGDLPSPIGPLPIVLALKFHIYKYPPFSVLHCFFQPFLHLSSAYDHESDNRPYDCMEGNGSKMALWRCQCIGNSNLVLSFLMDGWDLSCLIRVYIREGNRICIYN